MQICEHLGSKCSKVVNLLHKLLGEIMKRNRWTPSADLLEGRIVTSEVVGAIQFLEIIKNNPASVKTSKFVAPRIGGKGFGYFEIEYKTPKLVTSS